MGPGRPSLLVAKAKDSALGAASSVVQAIRFTCGRGFPGGAPSLRLTPDAAKDEKAERFLWPKARAKRPLSRGSVGRALEKRRDAPSDSQDTGPWEYPG